MLLPILAGAFQLAAAIPQPVHHARQGATTVAAVRLDTTVTIDGRLDEPAWQRAALLTGFSLYAPADDRPAPDSTEILVWYSRDALHVGVRAFEPHGAVRATLAERDQVSGDDHVEIHLDTFDERRRAMVFIVNPLGVQADGTRNEGGGFIPGANVGPGENDLSADFVWQSRGRVTADGYEVELRIPFSSLRYPLGMPQQWGIQALRRVQHSGYEQTWTPARRASASFIAQAGRLTGLTGMHHGQVVELNPELTSTVIGAPCCAPVDDGWRYGRDAQLGGNVRWALGSNFVVNGTIRPDFSQVEADAAQIAADQRFALFYPERRPFFVEGSDQFNVPNSLVYTRTIVQPEAAAKITGKFGASDIAVLSALDDRGTTADGSRPWANIARLSRGFGAQSTAGVLYSGRTSRARDNHVAGVDTRIVFGGMYFAQVQAVQSVTTTGGETTSAPMWDLVLDRTGRSWGFNYSVTGIDEGFETDNGFVRRTGYVEPSFMNRYTAYGTPGGLFERYNVFVRMTGLWDYDDFFAGRRMLENQFGLSNDLTLRGGWSIGFDPSLASYAFDPADYVTLWVPQGPSATAVPFEPRGRITAQLTGFSVSTPQYRRFSAEAEAQFGTDVDFAETSRVRRRDVGVAVNLRPTERLRVEATYQSASFRRQRDGERTFSTRIPRLKAEYQIARPVFVRVVSQYESVERAAVRHPETGEILLVGDPVGGFQPLLGERSNALRTDWLFSYRPSPGAVFFVGYGNTLAEPASLAFRELTRVDDAFFVKLSYVFRMQPR